MKIPDILLICSILVVSAVFAISRERSSRWFLLTGCLLLGLLAAQVILSGFYWQMAAAGGACLLLAAVCFAFPHADVSASRLLAAGCITLAGISFACLLILPIFRLPSPTGPYPVGTRIVHLVDESRTDSSFAGGKRELMVQVWYPAVGSAEPLASYRRWRETTFISSYDAVLKTHSRWNAAILKTAGKLPVLLFNPAWGGSRTQNTFEMEDLASHGFLVIAIDHTHNSALVAFPHGEVIRASATRAVDDFAGSNFAQQLDLANRELAVQTQDDIFVLDSFARWSADPLSAWYQAMDIERVGALGHSFGGATAVEAAFRDPRIRAALNMDGWMFGDIASRPLTKPLFVMYEDGWPPDAALYRSDSTSASPSNQMDLWDYKNLERMLAASGGYVLTIRGTRHMDFSDRSLYSPLRRFTDSGPIDPRLAHRIINSYTLAFFSAALRNQPQPLLTEASPWPQASLTVWKPPAPSETQNRIFPSPAQNTRK
jgi:pimeloyl-ACP methyl ester carboxylesterase